MKTFFRVLLLSFALASLCLAQPSLADTTQNTVRPAEWATSIDASFNLHQITPTLYRSAQPEQRDAATLQKLGIRTIINLRAFHDDKDVLNLPGVKLINIPMNTWHIEDEDVAKALHTIAAAQKEGAVLIHCQHGADRTGVVSAMYRVVEQGWTREQAVRELREGGYGFHKVWAHIPRYVRKVDIAKLRGEL
jgi:protein tyrosine/serine phosphatase